MAKERAFTENEERVVAVVIAAVAMHALITKHGGPALEEAVDLSFEAGMRFMKRMKELQL